MKITEQTTHDMVTSKSREREINILRASNGFGNKISVALTDQRDFSIDRTTNGFGNKIAVSLTDHTVREFSV